MILSNEIPYHNSVGHCSSYLSSSIIFVV